MRIDNKLCKPIAIPVEKLYPFEGHPYKVLDNEEMEMLTESVQNEGVLSPLIVRPLEGTDRYEVISGHRRLHAAQRGCLKTIFHNRSRQPLFLAHSKEKATNYTPKTVHKT